MDNAREELEDVIRDFALEYDLRDYQRATTWQSIKAAIDTYNAARIPDRAKCSELLRSLGQEVTTSATMKSTELQMQ